MSNWPIVATTGASAPLPEPQATAGGFTLPEGTLVADGWDEALIGYGWRLSIPIAVYDRDKMIEVAMRDGTTEEEADEYISVNIEGAYVGEGTPLVVVLKDLTKLRGLTP